MTTQYFVDGQGNYLGGFDGATPPDGAIEVPEAPTDARQIWAGNAWGAVPPAIPVPPTPREWLERLSPATQATITAAAAKDASGALLLWLLKASGNPTIDVTAAETVAGVQALAAMGIITAAEQAALLAP